MSASTEGLARAVEDAASEWEYDAGTSMHPIRADLLAAALRLRELEAIRTSIAPMIAEAEKRCHEALLLAGFIVANGT